MSEDQISSQRKTIISFASLSLGSYLRQNSVFLDGAGLNSEECVKGKRGENNMMQGLHALDFRAFVKKVRSR